MLVDRRTTAPHGITGPEVKRLGNAVWYIKQHCNPRRRLWLLTTDKATPRAKVAGIWKRIGTLQGNHDLPKFSVMVLETRPALHAHIVFIGSDPLVESLNAACIDVRRAYDADALVRNYLAKERTPQAGYYRRDLGGRLKGSHRLPGGGDRVRLSRELERDAIEGGYIEPWQHTNAKRQEAGERKPYRKRPLTKRGLTTGGTTRALCRDQATDREGSRIWRRTHAASGGA